MQITDSTLFWCCIYGAPVSALVRIIDLALLHGWPSWGDWFAVIWIFCAFGFFVKNRSTPRFFIVLALFPVACGLQLFGLLLALGIKSGRFAP